MRFHALGVQHTVTSKEYIACAFTQKVLKFCSMMTLRGHTVIHYGHQDSDVVCSEHVTVLSRSDYNRTYGEHDFRSNLFKFDQGDDAYKTFNANAIREINSRKQPGDFLLAFWGAGHQSICQGAGEGICVVEPGIGYPYGHFAEYKIFESYAMYHSFTNISRVANCVGIDTWSKEAIIPNYFDVSDFVDTVVPAKDRGDYFLFVGRIGCAKGVDHAIRMTERLGVRLLIAGQNAEGGLEEVGLYPPPGHVEIIGHVDVEKRKTLMANAKAVICMSMFTEPFCGVHVEAMMSGTPVITADWGAFTEFNVHGVTGFRCRTLDQMVEAGRRIHEIDPMVCRKWAFDNFSTPVVAKKYEDFFESIRPKHRVAVWMEANWAFGRYARAMKKYLPDVDVYDWANCETNRHLWIDGHWKDYQTIISNTSLLRLRETFGIDVPEEMSKRFLIISFFPKFEGTGYFQETLKNFPKNARYGGASLQICDVMRGLGVSNVKCIPFTADLEEFPVKHVVQHVKRLGIIGGPSRTNHPEYQDNKGIPMFDEICQKGGFEPVYIHGRTDDIYHDVDLLICCSKYEGAPTGIFEAAALGIPVLTRRVGCAQDVKGIAMYDTVDEALRQLKFWNENLDVLEEYTRTITREIRENWGLKTLIERHLKPTVYGLEYIMKKYGSGNYLKGCDKATLHSYAGTYESLFQSLRDKPVRILEIGVCSGGSLKVWEEYFTHPDAEIVGFDLSREHIQYTFGERTKFLIQDATREPPEGLFDIIIDDGSHVLSDQLGALQLLASHLKPNGLYIIEDIQSMENANTILETSKDVLFELKDLRSVRGQYDDVMLIGRPNEPKVKVAIWGETIWAIGRIHRAIQKYLDCARVDVYDWSNSDSNQRFFTTDWKDYDRIVTKSDIFKLEGMFGLKIPDGILNKLVVISHCPDLDHPYFKEHIEIRDGPVYAGVSKETCEALRKKGVRDPVWVPFGADTEIFKNTRVISPNGIERIGMICVQGHNAEYNSVKRPDMFEDICQRVGATPVYICNRLTEDATLYGDIDLLISCSEFEAGPLGIFEAASCGVPVLTRPVGNAKYIQGIRTFNTVDEAVDIIKGWNETSLRVYRDTITHEVHTNWSMKKCIKDYFEPCVYQPGITCILTFYKRPHCIQEQLDAVCRQTIKPEKIIVWVNSTDGFELPDEIKNNKSLTIIHSSENFGVWARFTPALLAKTPYVCVFDDDTIPGPRWFENCCQTMKKVNGLLGAIGVVFNDTMDVYSMKERHGWANPNENIKRVDIVGHSWFFKREWVQYIWEYCDLNNLLVTGEDIAFSLALQKHGIGTYVPPHPVSNPDFFGSDPQKANIYGNESVAISTQGNSCDRFNKTFELFRKEYGFKLLVESDMTEHVHMIFEKIHKGEPIAVIRPSDGEYCVLTETPVQTIDKWHASPETKQALDVAIHKASQMDNMYVGIPCIGCNIDIFDYYQRYIIKNLTYANVFVNKNVDASLSHIKNIKKPMYYVGPGEVQCDFICDRYVVDPYLVNNWTVRDLENIEQWVDGHLDGVVLVSMGPLAKILIVRLFEKYPRGQFLDIGSLLDSVLKSEYNPREYPPVTCCHISGH